MFPLRRQWELPVKCSSRASLLNSFYSQYIRYKEYNTPDALAQLNDLKLKDLGIASNDDRKLVLSALAKVGYTSKASPARRKVVLSPEADISRHSPSKQSQIASSSHHPTPLVSPFCAVF